MNKKKLPKAIRPEAATPGEAAAQPAPAREAAAQPAPTRPAAAARSAVKPEQAAAAPASRAPHDRHRAAAKKVVERFALWAGAAGLIPFPFVDAAAVGGVQIEMLRRLSHIYRVPFSKNLGRALVAGIAGSMIPATSVVGAASVVKGIPVVGTAVGAVAMPALSAAATYAIGTAFIQHFASGGTLLDFSPPDYREFIKVQKEAYRP
jgi:uncharacterized protein (DUF697 family)